MKVFWTNFFFEIFFPSNYNHELPLKMRKFEEIWCALQISSESLVRKKYEILKSPFIKKVIMTLGASLHEMN